MSAAPQPFVLVHGGMHGGWCWRRVARLLRSAGAEVFTPTLTGLGERSHLNGPHIDLAMHIEDIVNCIVCEELARCVLVGHSYSGMVITGVADRIGERVSHLVYLDAVVPTSGQSAIDAMGVTIPSEITMIKAMEGTDFGVKDPSDLAWVLRRTTPQSARTIRQKLVIQRDLSKMKRGFIACTNDRDSSSAAMVAQGAAIAKRDPDWWYAEIAAGHDAMVTAPREVAQLLLRFAAM